MSSSTFVIVMEVITKELWVELPRKLLCADDFIMMAESEAELRENIVQKERKSQELTYLLGLESVIKSLTGVE